MLFVDQPCRKSDSSSLVTFLLIHSLRTGSQPSTIKILLLQIYVIKQESIVVVLKTAPFC